MEPILKSGAKYIEKKALFPDGVKWMDRITAIFVTIYQVSRQYFFFELNWADDGCYFSESFSGFSTGISSIGILHWLHTLWATLPAQNASMPDFP